MFFVQIGTIRNFAVCCYTKQHCCKIRAFKQQEEAHKTVDFFFVIVFIELSFQIY